MRVCYESQNKASGPDLSRSKFPHPPKRDAALSLSLSALFHSAYIDTISSSKLHHIKMAILKLNPPPNTNPNHHHQPPPCTTKNTCFPIYKIKNIQPKENPQKTENDEIQVEDKVVCVTSGVSYLGLAIVSLLVSRGYHVRVIVHNQGKIRFESGAAQQFAISW